MIALWPGDRVYVVERDEDGDAVGVSGYMFLARVNNAAIVAPYFNGVDDLERIIDILILETQRDVGSEMYVFPGVDCYAALDTAKKALDEEGRR